MASNKADKRMKLTASDDKKKHTEGESSGIVKSEYSFVVK